MDVIVLILAAGEGKRMNSSLPKVLHEVAAKPMIRYVVDAARATKPKKIVVVVGRDRLAVRDVLEKNVKITLQKKPLGTADAVKAAKSALRGSAKDVIVLYGDIPLITEKTIRRLYDVHRRQKASCTVLTAFLENPKGYGRIIRNQGGHLIAIIEERDTNFQQRAIKEVNTGLYCFSKEDLLDGLKYVDNANKSGEYYLTDLIGWLFRKSKKVASFLAECSDEVLGVNSQRELLHAAQAIRMRTLETLMREGVNIMDPVTTFIDSSAKVGAGTRIFPFTFIEEGVVVGKDCQVGPFCHLRPGAVLEEKVVVGNFSEIKNSRLGKGAAMHHMGYIGDTRVGEKVNIGAGVVVANFDGKKKSRTVIKERAFIGCDAVLIAPVTVGKNAVVGAGSVVTKAHHVRDGATVMGVPAKETGRR